MTELNNKPATLQCTAWSFLALASRSSIFPEELQLCEIYNVTTPIINRSLAAECVAACATMALAVVMQASISSNGDLQPACYAARYK